jgi:CubicO group peptidase (beta-lactamase class C family)
LGIGTCYYPRKQYSLSQIVPTEKDDIFRKQLIHGDVHDQGAAMMGGVSGHAGVFSNAEDLAVIMQMYLLGGVYGGTRFIQPETVKEFTRRQFPLNDNRRGVGFDKPAIDTDEGPSCKSASANSYGHTGFTGTCAWADPDNGLIFIFLSNRVNPTSENRKINTLNVRTNLQQIFYDAIEKSRKFATH